MPVTMAALAPHLQRSRTIERPKPSKTVNRRMHPPREVAAGVVATETAGVGKANERSVIAEARGAAAVIGIGSETISDVGNI
jgi:hypothetical protein